MKTTQPKKAAVLWYSQTGHTERYGRLIAKLLSKKGMKVTASDYRDFDISTLSSYDLIIAGSPVFYFEVPENFRKWLAGIPGLEGIPAAAYSTFGGEGGNQYNTAFSLLEFFTAKGAVPTAIDMFGNMSAFAPTWSMGNTKRTLAYKDRPDEQTYNRVRAFTAKVIDAVKAGKAAEIEKETTIKELFKGGGSIAFTKILIGNHHIDKKTCIECGTCVRKCPVTAIDLEKGTVSSVCIACIGCVNNCPAGAMKMNFMGKPVYGFKELLKRNNIVIKEPAELS
ncbi:MAG: EFR1 family ferrodoxin [Spirochaetota bacterium]